MDRTKVIWIKLVVYIPDRNLDIITNWKNIQYTPDIRDTFKGDSRFLRDRLAGTESFSL